MLNIQKYMFQSYFVRTIYLTLSNFKYYVLSSLQFNDDGRPPWSISNLALYLEQ